MYGPPDPKPRRRCICIRVAPGILRVRWHVVCRQAFDRDGILDWRPPVFLQCRTIGLHEGRCLAEPAAVDDEPCIANPRGASHRDLGLGGDIERWSTRADGL